METNQWRALVGLSILIVVGSFAYVMNNPWVLFGLAAIAIVPDLFPGRAQKIKYHFCGRKFIAHSANDIEHAETIAAEIAI